MRDSIPARYLQQHTACELAVSVSCTQLCACFCRFIDGSVDMLDQFMSESAWSAPPQSYAATRAKGTAATSCAESRHMSSTAAPPGPQMQQRSTSNEPTAAQTAQQTRLAAVSTDGVKKPDALHKHAQKDMPDAHDRPEHVIVRDAAFQEPQQGIPVVHTDDLTYQQFVQCFMLPNLPVMIQVCCIHLTGFAQTLHSDILLAHFLPGERQLSVAE